MTDKLKPCPFCGGEAYKKSYDRLIQIGCEKCGYHMGFHGLVQTKIDTGVPIHYSDGTISTYEWYDRDAHKKANKAWNTRKPMDRIVEQLEGLPNVNSDYWNSSDLIDREDAIEIVKGGAE